MSQYLWIALGGSLGALARHALGTSIQSLSLSAASAGGAGFPFHTLLINTSGCFAIGLLLAVFRNSPYLPTISQFAGVGFLGAFTTFSTFSFEALSLYKRSEIGAASLYITLTLAFCLVAVALGQLLGTWIAASRSI